MISVCPYLIYDNPLIFLLSYSACFFIWPFPFKHIFVWYFLWKDNYPDICRLHITITIFWQDTQFWGCSYRMTSWLRLEANYFTRFTCFTFAFACQSEPLHLQVMVNSAEKVRLAGNPNVMVCERGTMFGYS